MTIRVVFGQTWMSCCALIGLGNLVLCLHLPGPQFHAIRCCGLQKVTVCRRTRCRSGSGYPGPCDSTASRIIVMDPGPGCRHGVQLELEFASKDLGSRFFLKPEARRVWTERESFLTRSAGTEPGSQ